MPCAAALVALSRACKEGYVRLHGEIIRFPYSTTFLFINRIIKAFLFLYGWNLWIILFMLNRKGILVSHVLEI